MKIAIIGTGNVGGALAKNWADRGHQILLGVRNVDDFKGKELTDEDNISAHPVKDAAFRAHTILVAATPTAAVDISNQLGDVTGKVIIDAMNTIRSGPPGYANSFEAFTELCKGAELVKCFNSTGFENMRDPNYNGTGIDMFMAGDSVKAKEVARELALDAGFGRCYDFGGADKARLLEQFAASWINLAIAQGQGRNIAFKVLRR